MPILIFVLIAIVGLMVIVAMTGDEDYGIECQNDIPCQECGKCYNEHPGTAFGHSYVYPRDIHR